jgi:hypothetical protein
VPDMDLRWFDAVLAIVLALCCALAAVALAGPLP